MTAKCRSDDVHLRPTANYRDAVRRETVAPIVVWMRNCYLAIDIYSSRSSLYLPKFFHRRINETLVEFRGSSLRSFASVCRITMCVRHNDYPFDIYCAIEIRRIVAPWIISSIYPLAMTFFVLS